MANFDDVKPYLDELNRRDIIDPTMQANIEEHTGNNLKIRINAFKVHNKEGIDAFREENYIYALQSFNRALKLEPLNSGALLNSIQVYLKQLSSKEKTSTPRATSSTAKQNLIYYVIHIYPPTIDNAIMIYKKNLTSKKEIENENDLICPCCNSKS